MPLSSEAGERLRHLANLKLGWAPYFSGVYFPSTPAATAMATSIIDAVGEDYYLILPTCGGGLLLGWMTDTGEYYADVGTCSELGFSYYHRDDDEEPLVIEPIEYSELVERIRGRG